jgi:hypothetical protein
MIFSMDGGCRVPINDIIQAVDCSEVRLCVLTNINFAIATCDGAEESGRIMPGSPQTGSFFMRNQKQPTIPEPSVDDRIIYDLRFQYRSVPMIALAQELGLFEALPDLTLGFDELAKATGTDGRIAETMLAVATSFGLLEREGMDQWRLSMVARTYLLESSPFYSGPLLIADDPGLVELRRACLEAGGPVRARAVAIKELTDDDILRFIETMHRLTLPAASALGRNEKFQSVKRLLDLAGGSGSLSIGISAQNASLRATLFDLPAVCTIAREKISD